MALPKVKVVMCDPWTLEALDELQDVLLDGSELSWGYYTDQRVSGTVKALGARWIDHSMLRILLEDGGRTTELATMFVQETPWTGQRGAQVVEYGLKSALAAISDDLVPWPWTIAAGVRTNDFVRSLIGGARRPYVIATDAANGVYGEPKVYEMGDSRLSILMDAASATGNRVGVDGHGRITWSRYVAPSRMGASFRIDVTDPQTLALDGVKGSTSRLNSPTRAVVTYHGEKRDANGDIIRGADNKAVEINLWSTCDIPGSETSGARGYVMAKHEQLQELADQTQAAIDAKARSVASQMTSGAWREWELTCAYMPIRMGDVGELVLPGGIDGGLHKVLVKNLKLDLRTLQMGLTLKEV